MSKYKICYLTSPHFLLRYIRRTKRDFYLGREKNSKVTIVRTIYLYEGGVNIPQACLVANLQQDLFTLVQLNFLRANASLRTKFCKIKG